MFRRAVELDHLGKDEEAKFAYLEYLQHKPDDLEALTNLGNLAYRSGYRRAARTAYRRAVQVDPSDCVAHVNFANALLDAGELAEARDQYEAAIALDPHFTAAHQGLSYVYSRLGDEVASRSHRERGFRGNAITHVPYRGNGTPIRAVVLVSAAGGNFNTEWFLDDRRFDVYRIAAEYADVARPLPPHDVLVNAIGDADLCHEALLAAVQMRARSRAPIVNAPHRVLQTKRIANARRLEAIPGVVTAHMALIPRTEVSTRDDGLRSRGFRYPVLLRTPGHHTGRHFLKVNDAADLPASVAKLPGDELLAIDYIDARSADGLSRKYRMMAIGGELYPVHAAISKDWKVHYFSADMASNPEHRAEDERFINDPEAVLSLTAMTALREIAFLLDLDYAGVDFSIDARGRLIVFEANATMSMVPPDPDPRFCYRVGAVNRVFAAFDTLLVTDSHNAANAARAARNSK